MGVYAQELVNAFAWQETFLEQGQVIHVKLVGHRQVRTCIPKGLDFVNCGFDDMFHDHFLVGSAMLDGERGDVNVLQNLIDIIIFLF